MRKKVPYNCNGQFFTSSMLFEDLQERGFYTVEIVRQGCVGFLTSLHVSEKGNAKSELEVRIHYDYHLTDVH